MENGNYVYIHCTMQTVPAWSYQALSKNVDENFKGAVLQSVLESIGAVALQRNQHRINSAAVLGGVIMTRKVWSTESV